MKPIQLPLGVRLRDDATFINYYPGANAAALGYVERLCEADAGWTESLIYLWGKQGVGRTTCCRPRACASSRWANRRFTCRWRS
jgi:DnaA family protein